MFVEKPTFNNEELEIIFKGLLLYRVRLQEKQAMNGQPGSAQLIKVTKLAKQVCKYLHGHEDLGRFVL